MLFDKADQTAMKQFKAAAKEVAVERWGADKIPGNLLTPFADCDGDSKSYDGYAGHYFFKAANYVSSEKNKHKAQPGVVDQNLQPIFSAKEFYSGCEARASILPKATGGPGTKFQARVSFGLVNIQKIADGTPFGGEKPAPNEDFDPIVDDADNPANYQAPEETDTSMFDAPSGSKPTTADALFA